MNNKVIDITSQFSIIPVPDRTELDEKVLSFCYHKPHKVLEIAEYLGISDSTYLRKQVLENMVKTLTSKRVRFPDLHSTKQIVML